LIPAFLKIPRLTVLLLLPLLSHGQKHDTTMAVFARTEKELKQLQLVTFHTKIEAERIAGNKLFLEAWEKIVYNPLILNYNFDNLKDVSILSPSDRKFMLITWNIHKDDGSHTYFGYLLVNNTKRVKNGFLRSKTLRSYDCFKLLDRSTTAKSPENHIGTSDKWFGMLYTQLIETDGYYTLVGWDGNDKLTQRKFIDVLYFKPDGTPIFGKDVFKMSRKNPKRLMFEYSQEVSMSLKYQEKRNQIVFSHLASNKEGSLLVGQPQFYGPDGSFDALEYRKGKWVLIEDIDARNEKSKNDNVKKPDPKKQTPVYKPR
jgi:hypothetical protein